MYGQIRKFYMIGDLRSDNGQYFVIEQGTLDDYPLSAQLAFCSSRDSQRSSLRIASTVGMPHSRCPEFSEDSSAAAVPRPPVPPGRACLLCIRHSLGRAREVE